MAKRGAPKGGAGWAGLTWDDLEEWAGSRSVERGRTYQRGGRVKNLKITPDGELLATVVGTERYATTVALFPGPSPDLESACTCPVGVDCKHAVAVVAEYLQALADGREVPLADENDPRWDELEAGGDSDDEDWDEDDEASWDDDEEEVPARKPRRSGRTAGGSGAKVDWDDKIRRHLRAKSQGELADLIWSLARRFPEVYQEFRERIALQEGDVGRLIDEARREIRRVTSEPAWRNRWNDEGYTPDYSRIRHRLERLLELGHADEVVSLGREFLQEGLKQVGESHDEGETGEAFTESLPVIFEAVSRSSLSGPERLLFAIDAELADDYGLIGDQTAEIFDSHKDPADWSAVADALAGRLADLPVGKEGADRFSRSYQRDRITGYLATALAAAGRGGELRALYESEARATGSYQRLVSYLIHERCFDDAERWAREGIAATAAQYPGIADQLAASLCEIARGRKQWDVVAAHAARPFFERPSLSTFDALIQAAKKAGVEEPVRAAALRFLETGVMPYQVVSPRPAAAATPRAKPSGKGRRAPSPKAASPSEPGATRTLKVDPAWPLPVPEDLIPLLDRAGRYDPGPRPHLDVLLDMAIAAKRPDEVLRWYDKMRAGPKRTGYGYLDSSLAYADRVAAAVSTAYPERAIGIYLAALESYLPRAEVSAYESATGYLKKLRPLYEALGRAGEWEALVASIRETYRNRPRFMEFLDRLEGRPIVQTSRPRRK